MNKPDMDNFDPAKGIELCVRAGIFTPREDGHGYELAEEFRHDESTGPEPGGIYRHQDGGIYRFLLSAKSSEDQSMLYIYEHLWPFVPGEKWARPAHEWDSRFTRIRFTDLIEEKSQEREKAQQEVLAAKAARRAAKGNA